MWDLAHIVPQPGAGTPTGLHWELTESYPLDQGGPRCFEHLVFVML